MGILCGGQQLDTAGQRVAARETPRSVVYRNQHAREVAAEEHALDYATDDSGYFPECKVGELDGPRV
jgi:hypothetical protein